MTMIWLNWQSHRRSKELAGAMGAELFEFISQKPRLLRYGFLSVKTILTIIEKRPDVLVVQNPSIVLATLVCLLKPVFAYRLVVDRHSNFKLHTVGEKSAKWRVFHLLSKYTVRKADITIVTNRNLEKLVLSWGGCPYVLQDRIPTLNLGEPKEKLQGEYNIVLISTFNLDEPISEVILAARSLPETYHIYITGNSSNFHSQEELGVNLPVNVSLTGFLDEEYYQWLITSADIAIVMTKNEDTLNCGAYECLSVATPMILSNSTSIREFFSFGAIYADPNSSANILAAVKEGIRMKQVLVDEIQMNLPVMRKNWQVQFDRLMGDIDRLPSKVR